MAIAVRYSAFRRKSAGGRRDGALAGAKDFCAIEKINAPTRLCEPRETLRMIDGILD